MNAFVCSLLLLLSSFAAAAGDSAKPPASIRHLRPGMSLRAEDLSLPASETGVEPDPAALETIRGAASALLEQGPIAVARRGDEVALLPLQLSENSRALFVDLAAGLRVAQAGLLPLGERVSGELRHYLGNGDSKAARAALGRVFDALSVQNGASAEPDAAPGAARKPDPPLPHPGEKLTLEHVFTLARLGGGNGPFKARWSPDSKRVAYLDGDGGLWVYDWETGKRELWIGKVDSQNYSWTDSGAQILFLADKKYRLFDIARRTTRLLGPQDKMKSPSVSPDGKTLAFVRDEQIWIKPLDSRRPERRLTTGRRAAEKKTLRAEMTPARPVDGFAWAPDSRRIAYSFHTPSKIHAFPLVDYAPIRGKRVDQHYVLPGDKLDKPGVGIVTLQGRKTIVRTPRDTAWIWNFFWTSRGLAVEALSRESKKRTLIVVGAARWVDEDPRFVTPESYFHVLGDGTPVALSERSGRRHIYVGGRQLTSGDWNVNSIDGVDDGGGWIYYTSNEGKTTENQLWRIRIDGSGKEELTTAPGWHMPMISPDGKRWIDEWSNVGQSRVLAPLQTEPARKLEALGLVEPKFVKVPAADGSLVDGMLIKPADAKPGEKLPVIVYVYGGAFTQMVKNQWGADMMFWHQMMAQKGFAVLVLDNRLSGAYPTGIIRKLKRHLGTIELLDLRAGMKWLKSQPWVDTKRIGIWGWSFGGYMTLQALIRLRDFAAGSAVAAVTDWKLYNPWYTESRLGLPKDNKRGYQFSSPAYHAKRLKGWLLFMHGLYDDNVHYQHHDHFIGALDDTAHFRYEQRVYGGQRHDIARKADWMNLFGTMTDFFLRRLRSKPRS